MLTQKGVVRGDWLRNQHVLNFLILKYNKNPGVKDKPCEHGPCCLQKDLLGLDYKKEARLGFPGIYALMKQDAQDMSDVCC